MVLETKKLIALIKDENNKLSKRNQIIEFASEYWASEIANAGKNQINYEMNHELLPISVKKLEKFKKIFVAYISKRFPKDGEYINLWTSDGKVYDQIGIEPQLDFIIQSSDLNPKILPSDVCMWIYGNRIEIEKNFQHKTIYNCGKEKTFTL